MKARLLLATLLTATLLNSGEAQVPPVGHAPKPSNDKNQAALTAERTEEGQSIIYDAYTWRRRELTKKLPLSEAWPTEANIAEQFRKYGFDKAPMPETIPVPSRLMSDVYLVNSDSNHTYLIDAGKDGLILIDPGLEENVEPIRRRVEQLGFSPNQIKWVINTHAHFDHSMADAHFQRLGAKILIGRNDAAAVEKGTQVTAKYALPKIKQAAYPTLHVDWPVDDGEELTLGNKTIYAISTPGHTPGSTCFRLVVDGKEILFGGDTILFDYRLGAQATPYADNVAYAASLKKLVNMRIYPPGKIVWDALLPGHGTIVLDRAYLDVMKGARQVQLNIDAGEAVNALPFATDDYRKLMFGRP
jgi:glyoxylase-like metal-dependent hydrolase (beta-lactamase superfamily II)